MGRVKQQRGTNWLHFLVPQSRKRHHTVVLTRDRLLILLVQHLTPLFSRCAWLIVAAAVRIYLYCSYFSNILDVFTRVRFLRSSDEPPPWTLQVSWLKIYSKGNGKPSWYLEQCNNGFALAHPKHFDSARVSELVSVSLKYLLIAPASWPLLPRLSVYFRTGNDWSQTCGGHAADACFLKITRFFS